MPLRPLSSCHRALACPTNAPGEGIWVTDHILSCALQRYINVSKAQKRAVSSVPGPLYHRNRFGRRQMTDLNTFQTSGSLPAWALENAPDMMQWKWQPPKPELWSPWPSPSSPPPTPTTPAPLLPELVPLPTDAVDPQHDTPEIVEESQAESIWHALHNCLFEIRTSYRSDAQAHTDIFKEFLETFEQTLSAGQISGAAAADVFETAYKDIEVVAKRYPEPARELKLRLMSSLAEGVSLARTANPEFRIGTSRFWDYYILRISQLDPTVETANLFAFGMNNFKTRRTLQDYGTYLKSLHRFFTLWQGAEVNGEPETWNLPRTRFQRNMAQVWFGRAHEKLSEIALMLSKGHTNKAKDELAIAKRLHFKAQRFAMEAASSMSNDLMIVERLAQGLRAKDPTEHRLLYVQAQELLTVPGIVPTRSHYNWLQILARLPGIQTPIFRRNLDIFPSYGYASLSQVQLCTLLKQHYETANRLDMCRTAPERWKSLSQYWTRRWESTPCRRHATVLADLAFLIWQSNPPTKARGVLWSYWEFVRERSGPRIFLRQLSLLYKRDKLSRAFMKTLAWTSNDQNIALTIHSELAKRHGKHKTFFHPSFWVKFAWRLNTKKSRDHGPALKLLGLLTTNSDASASLVHRASSLSDPRRKTVRLHRTTRLYRSTRMHIARLKAALMVIKRSQSVTDREAANLATKLTVKLANSQGTLSAGDLTTVTAIIMRPLDAGRLGSIKRLQWYLTVVDRYLGAKVSREVALILKRRRAVNALLWRQRRAAAVGKEVVYPHDQAAPRKEWWTSYMDRRRIRVAGKRKLSRPFRTSVGKYRQWVKSEANKTVSSLRPTSLVGHSLTESADDGFEHMAKSACQEKAGTSVTF